MILLILLQPMAFVFSYELAVATLFRNEANYIVEWVEYHHMLGVDHFILYNDRSDDNWAEVLEPYINSNLVEVIQWDKPESTSLFPTWQLMAYKDALRKLSGNTKWAAFIDIDEFIIPKKNSTILECLDQHYADAAGVYICWRNFGTNKVYVPPGENILTRLTGASDILHSRNASGKSIVRVDEVNILQIWSPHQLVLQPDAQYYNGSGEPLYFRDGDLQINSSHTSDYIQINHYVMRDENFYQGVRLPRAISREYGELSLLQEHYQSFNYVQDYTIIEFLKKYHPIMYESFWK